MADRRELQLLQKVAGGIEHAIANPGELPNVLLDVGLAMGALTLIAALSPNGLYTREKLIEIELHVRAAVAVSGFPDQILFQLNAARRAVADLEGALSPGTDGEDFSEAIKPGANRDETQARLERAVRAGWRLLWRPREGETFRPIVPSAVANLIHDADGGYESGLGIILLQPDVPALGAVDRDTIGGGSGHIGG